MGSWKFRVGQRVRVVRKCNFPSESDCFWAGQMDAMIGGEFTIGNIQLNGDVELDGWVFMPACIEPAPWSDSPEFEK